MNVIKEYKNLDTQAKTKLNTRITTAFGFIVGIIEIAIGVINSSLFLIISALFTIFLGIVKILCLLGLKNDSECKSLKYVNSALVLIIISGILYANSNVKLLLGVMPKDYGIIVAITIALFSFINITISIINIFKHKHQNRYYKVLKAISFLSALTNIMLTQMSLLIVCDPEMPQRYNVYLAFSIGVFTIILGIIFLVLINKKSAHEQ